MWEDGRGLGFIVIPSGKCTAGMHHGSQSSEHGRRMRFISSEESPSPGLGSPKVTQNFSPTSSTWLQNDGNGTVNLFLIFKSPSEIPQQGLNSHLDCTNWPE